MSNLYSINNVTPNNDHDFSWDGDRYQYGTGTFDPDTSEEIMYTFVPKVHTHTRILAPWKKAWIIDPDDLQRKYVDFGSVREYLGEKISLVHGHSEYLNTIGVKDDVAASMFGAITLVCNGFSGLTDDVNNILTINSTQAVPIGMDITGVTNQHENKYDALLITAEDVHYTSSASSEMLSFVAEPANI